MNFSSYIKEVSKNLFLAIIPLALSLSSCNEKKERPSEFPNSGTLEYDIIYSGSIKDNGILGSMLPSKLYGTYSSDGAKINFQAGLGLVKLEIVATVDDSYLVLNISGNKMLVPFDNLFTESDYQKRDSSVVFTQSEHTEIMAGYESECIIAESQTPFGKARVETYYVPFEPLSKKLKDSPIPDVPGFITAMKMTSEEANVVIMLSNFEAKDVLPSDFQRPTDCKYGTRCEIDSLIRINFERLE